MKIHMYLTRHLFVDDDCVGKFDSRTRTIRVFERFQDHGQAIAKWFRQHHGVFPAVEIGEKAVERSTPVVEFPPEIREKMSDHLGDLTPEVVAWAREHWTEEDFKARYKGRVRDAAAVAGPPVDPFEGEEFPQFITDDEDRRVRIDRRPGGGFAAVCDDFEHIGTGDTPADAAQDLREAIELAELMKPAGKDDGQVTDEGPADDGQVTDEGALPAADDSPPPAKKAAKKKKD